MFDTTHPWLRPIWVRVAIVAGCLIWALFEYRSGALGWGAVFAAIGVYTAVVFIKSGVGNHSPDTSSNDTSEKNDE